jgi:hypothetical protein
MTRRAENQTAAGSSPSSCSAAPESNLIGDQLTNPRRPGLFVTIIGSIAPAHPNDETSLCADRSSEGDSKPSQVTILLSLPAPQPFATQTAAVDPIGVTGFGSGGIKGVRAESG